MSKHDIVERSLPLLSRFPALTRLPRVALGRLPTPVERVHGLGGGEGEFWIKRDDLTAPTLGGNKVRALEFLLPRIRPGDRVLTVGGTGSTHALATAHYARLLGATTTVIHWRQEMNPTAVAVSAQIEKTASERVQCLTTVEAYVRAFRKRLRGRVRWIPAGGTSALGMLGHVNAALELDRQIRDGEMPEPSHIVVPLGSGGTVAGLMVGLAICGRDAELVAVRVVPRIVANRVRLTALIGACRRLIVRESGARVPPARLDRVRIVHAAYGGAYGRPTAAGAAAADGLRDAHGVFADPTYSAKALAVALAEQAAGVQLFWLTFDARWMRDERSAS